ncbi:hypothetical protein [Archangium primigenium]|uniref:hypothetical protein n=1 Tax=[Archangium] primigenium TaxID=2792470 RepID=UPI00195D50A1|nr:hypothetical protein [Archangium primigenium]MBM7114901.1 hypothetical protein [Archangium primigenium]
MSAALATGCGSEQMPTESAPTVTESQSPEMVLEQAKPSQDVQAASDAVYSPLAGSINLNFVIDSNGKLTPSATGSETHVINDLEIGTFNLWAIRTWIGNYSGRVPEDAFLRGPTPWNNLYAVYGWPEVQTIVGAYSVQVLGTTTQPVALVNRDFDNRNNSIPATYSTQLTTQVNTTSTSTWNSTNTVTVGQSLKYGFTIFGTGVEGTTTFSYARNWGEGGSKSTSTTVGTTDTISVTVPAYQMRRATLSATKGTMRIRVKYRARLSGCAATNYYPKLNGHHFYCYDATNMLATSGQPTIKEMTEDMEIGYYSNATLSVYDTQGVRQSMVPVSIQ